MSQKNIDLVTKHGIYTEEELRARQEIHLENYCKIINIEGKTSVDMVLHQILPAALAYSKFLCDSILSKSQVGLPCKAESTLAQKISVACDALYENCESLRLALTKMPKENHAASTFCHEVIVPGMEAVRREADLLEQLTDKSYWPYPTYSDLLYY